MTSGLPHNTTAVGNPSDNIAKTYLSVFGLHTRYMLTSYLRHVFVVALALVTLALSIDLSPQMSKLLASDDGTSIGAVWRVARLAAFRTADLLPRFLAFAAFLGVLWVEASHTVSRERVVIWNSGRSPAQCLAPVLLLGLILGLIQASCDFYLRPAAMAAQIAERLGSYGERYSRQLTKTGIWLSAGNDLVYARIDYGPPAVLHNVTIYRLDPAGGIREVDNAGHAVPAGNGKGWLLIDGNSWSAAAPASNAALAEAFASPGEAEGANGFARRVIDLRVDAVWLSALGMSPIFLPQGMLRTIARSTNGSFFVGNFQTWVQARYGHALLPGLMALLASSLSLLLLAYRVRAETVLAIVLAGYVGDLATRVFLLLGEQGYVPPAVAGWFVPIALTCVSAGLMGASEMRRRSQNRAQRALSTAYQG